MNSSSSSTISSLSLSRSQKLCICDWIPSTLSCHCHASSQSVLRVKDKSAIPCKFCNHRNHSFCIVYDNRVEFPIKRNIEVTKSPNHIRMKNELKQTLSGVSHCERSSNGILECSGNNDHKGIAETTKKEKFPIVMQMLEENLKNTELERKKKLLSPLSKTSIVKELNCKRSAILKSSSSSSLLLTRHRNNLRKRQRSYSSKSPYSNSLGSLLSSIYETKFHQGSVRDHGALNLNFKFLGIIIIIFLFIILFATYFFMRNKFLVYITYINPTR